MAKPKGVQIQLIRERFGVGGAGEVVEVGKERAERWLRDGIAVLPQSASAKKKGGGKQQTDESRAAHERLAEAEQILATAKASYDKLVAIADRVIAEQAPESKREAAQAAADSAHKVLQNAQGAFDDAKAALVAAEDS